MGAVWEMNLMDGKNPVHTGGFLTAYDHREFSPEEVAARESGQNAMDAGRETKGITQLVFQKLVARGKKKQKLLELLELEALLKPRLPIFEKEPRNKLFSESVRHLLEDDELYALLIRDYNTCGLGGRWDRYEKGDHFARLVCALNLDDKADGDASSGGSFGLGKTAYAKSSNINTVIYHSVFNPTADTDGAYRRLMGAGVYPQEMGTTITGSMKASGDVEAIVRFRALMTSAISNVIDGVEGDEYAALNVSIIDYAEILAGLVAEQRN